MIYCLISFQKPSSERIVITQVVGFSFIDISVERVTGLENDADKIIWINVRVRSQSFLCVKLIDLNGRTVNTRHD
jgi:hypothetical protein